MMRSLFSGVSGLQNHQVRMDVIGNNISNVNTTGFKKGRVTFQDLFSQTLDSPSGPNDVRGGINPKQVGLGVSTASIDTIFNPGSLQNTGIKSDLAISGNGFFVVRNGEENLFTRAGAFDVDKEGWLVNPANGMRVQGWNADITEEGVFAVDATGPVTDISIPIQAKDVAKETSVVRLRSNLDKNTPLIPVDNPSAAETNAGTWTVEQEIFDTFGNPHVLQLNFTRNVDNVNQWDVATVIDPDSEAPIPTTVSVGDIPTVAGQTFSIQFDNNGVIQSVFNADGGLDETEELEIGISIEVPETTLVPDDAGILGPQIQNMTLSLGTAGSFTDAVTQFAASSSTKSFFQDGYQMGYLKDFAIDRSGNVIGTFSNQQKRILGQIALATFSNQEGLEKVGDTNFTVSINSGDPDIGTAATLDRGVILSGKLEMSNVDLSEDFTDMIITQRGFQANSRTIRTSDQLLQELLTLKQ